MTVRDVGMIALGFIGGMLLTSASLITMARDTEETERTFAALRRKFSDPRVQGQG